MAFSRRSFLKMFGIGAGAVATGAALPHVEAPPAIVEAVVEPIVPSVTSWTAGSGPIGMALDENTMLVQGEYPIRVYGGGTR